MSGSNTAGFRLGKFSEKVHAWTSGIWLTKRGLFWDPSRGVFRIRGVFEGHLVEFSWTFCHPTLPNVDFFGMPPVDFSDPWSFRGLFSWSFRGVFVDFFAWTFLRGLFLRGLFVEFLIRGLFVDFLELVLPY